MAKSEEIEADDDFEEDAEADDADLAEDADLDVLETFETVGDLEVLPEDDLEEDAGPDLDEDEETVVEDEAEESLDVLLAREKAVDDDDLGRLEEPRDVLTVTAVPISAEEFTCSVCFLVKNRAQLADEERLICLDDI